MGNTPSPPPSIHRTIHTNIRVPRVKTPPEKTYICDVIIHMEKKDLDKLKEPNRKHSRGALNGYHKKMPLLQDSIILFMEHMHYGASYDEENGTFNLYNCDMSYMTTNFMFDIIFKSDLKEGVYITFKHFKTENQDNEQEQYVDFLYFIFRFFTGSYDLPAIVSEERIDIYGFLEKYKDVFAFCVYYPDKEILWSAFEKYKTDNNVDALGDALNRTEKSTKKIEEWKELLIKDGMNVEEQFDYIKECVNQYISRHENDTNSHYNKEEIFRRYLIKLQQEKIVRVLMERLIKKGALISISSGEFQYPKPHGKGGKRKQTRRKQTRRKQTRRKQTRRKQTKRKTYRH